GLTKLNHVTKLTHVETELAQVAELTQVEVELTQVEVELAVQMRRAQKDPLGVAAELTHVEVARLKALRARLEAELATRARVIAAMDRAHALKRRTSEAHARAVGLTDQASREIERAAAHLKPPLASPLLEGLDQWLHKLDKTAQAHRWQSAEVG